MKKANNRMVALSEVLAGIVGIAMFGGAILLGALWNYSWVIVPSGLAVASVVSVVIGLHGLLTGQRIRMPTEKEELDKYKSSSVLQKSAPLLFMLTGASVGVAVGALVGASLNQYATYIAAGVGPSLLIALVFELRKSSK